MEPRDRTYAEVNATRRSVRSWTGEVVSRELLREVVADATLAPSAFNGQPTRYVVVQGEALGRVRESLGSNAPKVEAAGTLVALFADTAAAAGREAFLDGRPGRTLGDWAGRNVGLSAMNLLLAAWSHGLGARPMSGYDPTGLRDALDLSATLHPVMVVAVGWPDGEPTTERDRRPVDEVLTFVE